MGPLRRWRSSSTNCCSMPSSRCRRRSPGSVSRAQLIDTARSSGRRVVGVTAPAGYGKSTLLAEWARAEDRPVGWVSLAPLGRRPRGVAVLDGRPRTDARRATPSSSPGWAASVCRSSDARRHAWPRRSVRARLPSCSCSTTCTSCSRRRATTRSSVVITGSTTRLTTRRRQSLGTAAPGPPASIGGRARVRGERPGARRDRRRPDLRPGRPRPQARDGHRGHRTHRRLAGRPVPRGGDRARAATTTDADDLR